MPSHDVTLHLDYVPPFDWAFFLAYLGGRLTTGAETVENGRYTRAVEIDGDTGIITVAPHASRHQLSVSVRGPVARHADVIRVRLRQMFDLDADPAAIRVVLATEPRMSALVASRPGLRVPGAWSHFELLVRTIVGQQVSVRAATTIMGRIATRFGRRIPILDPATPNLIFPAPEVLADGDLSSIGMPTQRVRALRGVARAVADRALVFTDPDQREVRAVLLALPGIGPWTVEYFALRGLRDSDAWPGSDLVLKRAVESPITEAWRPYRGYAAQHLWFDAAQQQKPP
ncbi:dna-3-methyladenine glycosylase : 3-methyladenine DNA glycosylase/8-oxoguanine DNA glycosylase OS=Singulisphaera acidiphila (strain ATCC BAA-1392 / DSM 18658 / VKM B-2454 / MOB10) GN=Sinac_2693 PE=4 SV=1: AlkA_N: HhH-GPD [Gemmata massiliana]|uniref:DNA-3-methyladenine glycosylase II n=1 Tax=Gemmata massiliana TaxID=1210884 RepID=A0A6P2D286_9BACT|nr:AlkA N-terminal domain-containing protein [Gemmata massiliana]VTR95401.1 dna-3-methyladenine glycosylase : 3-methyladenine DNA glycosylase/8-oxoguanine DNA glycosylase OS=Singulisphaera acidiphila (strain ATCC BAA-1392 / DSM 18658 / VKM B-2454 / MOB10) GN=Sinac_2693 PE=4 SV=1: AlkA_N: HhH-GPD [Gemmata massiliana]